MDIHNILVIVAHPDDEVIGMGGTIARLTDEGHKVQVMYLTGGETSSGHQRKDETIRVAEKLGLQTPIHCCVPDQKLDTYAQSSLNTMISEVVQKVKPNIVYTHAKEDLNIDHRIVHDSVMVACRPRIGCSVTELYTFCVSEWDFGEFGQFQPNTFVHVNMYMDKKLDAMGEYHTELRPTPHPMSLESIRQENMHKGAKFCLWEMEDFKQVFRLI
jgi:LmbE family N-acetylglucosaminyl deacetylase